MGLVLDGVPTYRNISKVLPEFGKLSMFDNPELYKFKDEIRLFRPYSPHDDTHIVIQVMSLRFFPQTGTFSCCFYVSAFMYAGVTHELSTFLLRLRYMRLPSPFQHSTRFVPAVMLIVTKAIPLVDVALENL